MIRTEFSDPAKRRRKAPFFIAAALILFATASLADAYSDARAELIAAYQAEDFAQMQVAANKALAARPGYPGARFNLALAKALAGDSDGALQILMALVTSGVDFGIAGAEEFAALQSLPGWQAYADAVAELHEPVGTATVAYRYDAPDFVPEGIATIGDELLLGSIRHGSIVRIGAETELLSDAAAAGHWSVFGMRVGPDGGLWFASAAVPEYVRRDAAHDGSTGLFRLDLKTRAITVRALLPERDPALVLGDLVFADDDTIYATESLQGALYRYRIATGEMTEVIGPGSLRSMQGLVLDASGKYLYVADYVGGLFRVRLADYALERVNADAATTLFGIDGLYRYGNELIAIQNGIQPHRVVAFALAEDGLTVTGSRVLARNLAEFDEPTLGVVVGDELLFIANSHWNRFDRDGNLEADLSGPIVLKLSLERSLERDRG